MNRKLLAPPLPLVRQFVPVIAAKVVLAAGDAWFARRGSERGYPAPDSLGGADQLAVSWHHPLVDIRPVTESHVGHRRYERAAVE